MLQTLVRVLAANRGFVIFMLSFGLFRLAVADWNPIPSGSMRPTLLEGDVVLVNRTAYDLKLPLTDLSLWRTGEPQRGDVVVFTSPADGVRLIKRLVAVGGDRVEMRGGVLWVNGVAASYRNLQQVDEEPTPYGVLPALRATEAAAGTSHAVQVLPQVPARRDWGPVDVPQDRYFFLGDNRDLSHDSRYYGTVAREALIGRAHHLLASADILGHWAPRWDRFGAPIR